MNRDTVRADEELVELLEDFFAREVTPDVVEAAERRQALPASLWERACAVQIPWIGIREEDGGVGGTIADVVALMHHAASRATPLPLLEHHLAATLVSRAGLGSVDGLLAVAGLSPREDAPLVVGGSLEGRIADVAGAADAAAVAVLTHDGAGQDVVAVVRRASYDVEPATRIDGTPAPTVVLSGGALTVNRIEDRAAVQRYAELLRCSALAGLIGALDDLTSGYVAQRHQFGKPVGAFQAVQIHTVTLAQAASVSALVVDRAAHAVALGAGDFEVAAASVVVAQHAALAVAAAHQAHGAIGMTREYPLQQLTRRVHVLRQLWGSSAETAELVGRTALAAPSLAELVARHPEEGPIPR